jgi:hypothetical protein
LCSELAKLESEKSGTQNAHYFSMLNAQPRAQLAVHLTCAGTSGFSRVSLIFSVTFRLR